MLTDDMDICIYTGSHTVERHHVFGGSRKALSERYGFIAPLAPYLHPNGTQADKQAKSIDDDLKRRCQEYYERHYGTREQFIQEFGRSYI